MKKCNICNSENVRNYPFELGFITSHIPHEDGILPVNPKVYICMDCGNVSIVDMAAVDTIKKMDKISTAVKAEKDKFVAKAKEKVAVVDAKIKEIEAKIITIEAQIVAKAVEEKVKAELTAAKEKLQSELKATKKIKDGVVSAYEAIKAKVAGMTTTSAPEADATADAPIEATNIETAPAEEKEPILNPEAVNSIKNAFSAGKSFLKKAFAKPEATDETTAE